MPEHYAVVAQVVVVEVVVIDICIRSLTFSKLVWLGANALYASFYYLRIFHYMFTALQPGNKIPIQ
jgi:hypothetical protein